MKKHNGILVTGILAIFLTICSCSSMSMDTIKYSLPFGNSKMIASVDCKLPDADIIKVKQAVMFDFDSAKIRADQEETLDKVASIMKENADIDLVIDGYASIDGSKEYNMGLSGRRAESVKEALGKRGVSADRILETNAKGETEIFGDILKENRRAMIINVDGE